MGAMTCNDCKYWDGAEFRGSGFCRKNPPVLEQRNGTFVTETGLWPVTQATDWCGEHAEKDGK
jgi:hypothetical protein